MYTQNTPIHVKLWHREFWHLALANLLLTMSVYMLIPSLPVWLLKYFTTAEIGIIMGVFGVGLFLLGGFCTYLVQRYRRNQVCMWSILGMIICLALLYYNVVFGQISFVMMLAIRIALGMFFGLSQMILVSTLIIDTCESFQRTEANHSATWFGRFALSLGPICALVLKSFGQPLVLGIDLVLIGAMCCCVLAAVLIMLVKFPFKAPEDNVKVLSLDRFFLPHGTWLFINLVLITSAIGMLLTLPLHPMFYCMMMAGFLVALLAQKYVFVNAELKSEVISGLFLIGSALLMLLSHQKMALTYIAPIFIGTGIGIVGARFLLFFIKLSRHCQRGTSQSTYFLAWELGIALGLFAGYYFFSGLQHMLITISFVVVAVAFLMYLLFTHNWYLRNKNR